MFLFVLHGCAKPSDPLAMLIGLCRLLYIKGGCSSFKVLHFHGLLDVLISVQGISVVPLLVIFWPLPFVLYFL